MDSFEWFGEIGNQPYDTLRPPGDIHRETFCTARMGLESFGGGGGTGAEDRYEEIADKAHEQNMHTYEYDWEQTQRQYNHHILQNQAQRHAQEEQRRYNEAMQEEQYMYASAAKELKYNAEMAAFNKSEILYGHQLRMNEITANYAVDSMNAQTHERQQQAAFEEEMNILDYQKGREILGYQRDELDASRLAKQLQAERQREKLTSERETARGKMTAESQKLMIEQMRGEGQIAARGQTGKSVTRQYQAIVNAGAMQRAAQNYQLNRSDIAYSIAMYGIDQTLKDQEMINDIASGKITVERDVLEEKREVQKRELLATELSIFGAQKRGIQGITHEEYSANMKADMSRMSKPDYGLPVPKPMELPQPVIIDPMLPVKGEPPVWGASVGPPPSAQSSGGGGGMFGAIGGAVGAIGMAANVFGPLGVPIGMAVGGLFDAFF